MARLIIAIALFCIGLFSGVRYGFWGLSVGGTIDLMEAMKAENIDPHLVGWGLIKFWSGTAVTVVCTVLGFLLGWAVLED